MLVGVDGRPLYARAATATRGSEMMEERINAELRALDSLLHIRWMPFAVGIPGGRREGRYALCSYWPDVDPRRAQVRAGQYDPNDAFDIIGWFCEDLQDASSVPQDPESIMRKVLDLLHSCDNTRFPWRMRMAQCIEHNKRRQQKVKEEAVQEIKDMAADQYYHSNRASRVFMNGGR
jgi:hypothetical protein